ncbi:MAG: DUF1013 domain-containing protein [Pseudomonadota bacterium]|jgi:hypothetical protein|nr:DUF1013 domain-containing protein [Pseudomonadota bacterium]QKK06288.1 MAG: DUF1013 domain-containing protein [Pseudomonadota bacterium]
MAQHPLMPKATAVWLIDNTGLTFEQIAEFCGLHKLEIQAIADGEIGSGIIGANPVTSQELTEEEIKACEKDSKRRLTMMKTDLPQPKTRTKGPRYTPVAKRADKPNAIAWLLKTHPELMDSQIAKLIGTTKPTIQAIRDKSHISTPNLKPQDPLLLGLCKRDDFEKALERAQRRVEREAKAAEKKAAAKKPAAKKDAAEATPAAADAPVAEAAQEDAATEESTTESVEARSAEA